MRYNSIFQNEFTSQFCFRCGCYGATDWHHIFNASNKKQSEKYGAMIRVCRPCHNEIHKSEMLETKIMAQEKIMDYYKLTEDEFRDIFGKIWIKEETK